MGGAITLWSAYETARRFVTGQYVRWLTGVTVAWGAALAVCDFTALDDWALAAVVLATVITKPGPRTIGPDHIRLDDLPLVERRIIEEHEAAQKFMFSVAKTQGHELGLKGLDLDGEPIRTNRPPPSEVDVDSTGGSSRYRG